VNKILVIGSVHSGHVDHIEWTQPFCDLEKYACLIIDLSSFPRDYPRTLFKNIGLLKRTTRLFIRDNKEIFCIMEKPFKILFKQIPLNYSWMPFPQRLTVNPMLLGKTINITDKRFKEYMENVEKWDSELFWEQTEGVDFDSIAVNKEGNSIAATVTMINRGKIHFLPITTTANPSQAIEMLIEIANKNVKQEHQWIQKMECLDFEQTKKPSNSLNNCRNLFSVDDKKIVATVYQILEDLEIQTATEFDATNGMVVQTFSSKGKVEAKNPKINKIARFIENQRNKRKVIVVANTYKELPLPEREHKQHIDAAMKLFFETNNTIFLTTQSLYNLTKKIVNGQISIKEAKTLLQTQNGEIHI
jgi:hypothetical protein